jgi:hypothetical protein
MTAQKQGFADVVVVTMSVEQLDEALRRPGATTRAEIAGEFGRLGDLVAALPLTTDEYCFAANWIAGAREYWSAGDRGAARYQLRMIGRKFARAAIPSCGISGLEGRAGRVREGQPAQRTPL